MLHVYMLVFKNLTKKILFKKNDFGYGLTYRCLVKIKHIYSYEQNDHKKAGQTGAA